MTKYDWSNVPKNVNWIATDGYSGEVWGYRGKIVIRSDQFVSEDENEWPIYVVDHGVNPFKGDWRESLEERPNA